MPNRMIFVPFLSDVLAKDVQKADLLACLTDAGFLGSGVPNQSINSIKPVPAADGTLTGLKLVYPDAIDEAELINTVTLCTSYVTSGCPVPFTMFHIENIELLASSQMQDPTKTTDQRGLEVQSGNNILEPNAGGWQILARSNLDGTFQFLQDNVEMDPCLRITYGFHHETDGRDLEWNNLGIRITYDGGQTWTMKLTNPITVTNDPANLARSQRSIWLASDETVYWEKTWQQFPRIDPVPAQSYAFACQQTAL